MPPKLKLKRRPRDPDGLSLNACADIWGVSKLTVQSAVKKKLLSVTPVKNRLLVSDTLVMEILRRGFHRWIREKRAKKS